MHLARAQTPGFMGVALSALLVVTAHGCKRSPRVAVPVLSAAYVRRLAGPPASEARALAFSPDGSLLAVTYFWPFDSNRPSRGWVSFYRVADGSEARPTAPVNGVPLSIAFSPDGRYVLVGMVGNGASSLFFWVEGVEVRGPELLRRQGDSALAFSPDGASVAVARSINLRPQILLFPVPDGPVARDLTPLLGALMPTPYVTPSGREPVDVAFSPDGSLLAFTRSDGARGLARVADGALLRSLGDRDHGRGEAIAFSPDGARVASTNNRSLLQMWEVADGRLRFRVEMPSGGPDTSDIAFDPLDDRVFVLGPDATVLALSGSTGATLGALGAVSDPSTLPTGAQSDLAHGASNLCVSRDGRWLAFTDGLKGARLFRLR